MTVTADSNGHLTGHFTIPAGVPAGTKLVELIGQGGTDGKATFVGRGQLTVTELQSVENVTRVTDIYHSLIDPLAETFTLDTAVMVSGLDVWFSATGSTGKCFVQIRETANGVPTNAVLASQFLPTSSLTTGGWFRFSWPPVRIEAKTEYAIVIGCDDAVTAVSLAVLGQFDSNVQQWVTSQPYQIGVMLSSSNASTWTAHQDRDLSFRLQVAPITSTSLTIAMPSVSVTGANELMVLAAVEKPTSDCGCTFVITLPDATVVIASPGQRIVLATAQTGTITWAAVLTGSATATPRLAKDVALITATRTSPATYVSRIMPSAMSSHIAVYFEQLTPGSSSILVEATADQVSWTTVPVITGTSIGENWVDIAARYSPWNHTTCQIRLTLTGTPQARPEIRKLRVVIT